MARRTPIEQYIDNGTADSPNSRYEHKRRSEGYVRRSYWVHKDDIPALAEYAKKLEEKRGGKRD